MKQLIKCDFTKTRYDFCTLFNWDWLTPVKFTFNYDKKKNHLSLEDIENNFGFYIDFSIN